MTETIEYEQFDQTAGTDGRPQSNPDLSRVSDIPMELSVEIGRTHMTVGETLDLRVGSTVTLERLAGEPVDLLVNGTTIARGEVIVIDEQFGLRVTEIVDGQEPDSSPATAATAAAAGAGATDAAGETEQAEGAGAESSIPEDADVVADASPVAEG